MKKSSDTAITLETFIKDFYSILSALDEEVFKTQKELIELNKKGKKNRKYKNVWTYTRETFIIIFAFSMNYLTYYMLIPNIVNFILFISAIITLIIYWVDGNNSKSENYKYHRNNYYSRLFRYKRKMDKKFIKLIHIFSDHKGLEDSEIISIIQREHLEIKDIFDDFESDRNENMNQ